MIRACDLVAHGRPDLSEEELRADWASMDLLRDAWLALGPSGEALCYVAVSEGGTGRIDVELYALPGHAGGNIGAHLLRLAEDRAREMVVATPLGPSQHPPVPSSVVLQSTVGGADGAARKLLESVG